MNLGCSDPRALWLAPPKGEGLLWFSRKAELEAGHRGGQKRLYSPKTQSVNQRPKLLHKKSQSNHQSKDCKRKDKLGFLRLSLSEQLPLSLGRVWALASPGCRQAKHLCSREWLLWALAAEQSTSQAAAMFFCLEALPGAALGTEEGSPLR